MAATSGNISVVTGFVLDVSGPIPAVGAEGSYTVGIPVPAAAPAGPEAVNIVLSDSTLADYTRTVDRMRQLLNEEVVMKVQQAHMRLHHTEDQVKEAQVLLGRLKKVLAKETKDFVHVNGKWYLGKVFRSKEKQQARVMKEEEEMNKAQADVEHQEAVLAQLQRDMAQQTAAFQEQDAKVKELNQLQAFEAALVERVFQGEAGDAQENQLERTVGNLAAQLATVRGFATAYEKAQQLLQASLKYANTAERALHQALSYSSADITTNFLYTPGFGFATGIGKTSSLHSGQHHARAAAQLAVKAKQILPSIPNLDLSRAQNLVSTFNAYLDVAFDNFVTDFITHSVIQRDLGKLRELRQEITQALRWVEQWLAQRIRADYAAVQAQYSQQEAALDVHRRAVIQHVLASRGSSGNNNQ